MAHLFENLWVKIAALILAILLWFHVATEKVYQDDVYLPLTSVDITGDLLLIEPPPDSILITVAATGKKLLRTDWKKRGLKLLINRNHPGRFRVEFGANNLSLVNAEEVDIISILEPRDITLNCDRKIMKELPVRCRVVIQPDEGFAVTTADSLIPSIVLVTGPNRVMTDLDFVETEEKLLEGVRNNLERKIAVNAGDIYGLIFEPDTVVAIVEVEPVKRVSFSNLPVKIINSPPEITVKIEPDTVKIALSGRADAVDSVSAAFISVIADYARRDSLGIIPLQVIFPPFVTLAGQSVETVKVIEE
jgi:YbbR domain-containing protein